MAADDLWHGLTIDAAEAAPTGAPDMPGGGNCQSVPEGFLGGCPSGIGSCNGNYWGNNGEVQFIWNVATHLVDQMELLLGYLGTMDIKSVDGMHTYTMKIGDVPKKDGQPFLIDWTGNPNAAVTEIFLATMNTFAQNGGVPFDGTMPPYNDPAFDCGASGDCLVYNSAGQWIFGIRPLTVYFEGVTGVPQPALSTPTLLYNFFSKAEPYSNLPQTLALDANGPVATGAPLGATGGQVCTQKVGTKFADFRANCIQVHDNGGPIDTVNLNKVLYGLSHDFEHWTANVLGINQNFTSGKTIADPTAVVLDDDKPQDDDVAEDWFFDLRAKGHVRNEYNTYGTRSRLDQRGSAMIYIEWARLMLQDIHNLLVRDGRIPATAPVTTLGDPNCTGGTFGPGCTGIEGMLIPAGINTGTGAHLYDFGKDVGCPGAGCLDPGANWDWFYLFYNSSKSPLRPGDIRGGFCADPGAFTDCIGGTNSPFNDAYSWVTRWLGKGSINNLPVEMRDRRYYYRWFSTAYLKYFKAYSDFTPAANRDNTSGVTGPGTGGPAGLAPSNVRGQYIDREAFFFDSPNAFAGNGFDKFEYVDRENIGSGPNPTVPWDFEYGCDIIGGNQRYDNWYRRMDREETAMYSAMLLNKAHTPGQENNVNITNMFGNGILPANWPSYACAVGAGGESAPGSGTPACANPPLDVNGKGCGGCATNCIAAKTYVNGVQGFCASAACDYTAHPQTGCAAANETCVTDLATGTVTGCIGMAMDLNGPSAAGRPAWDPTPKPRLYYYQGVWSRTPFASGHSPITILAADKKPNIGAAKITIPNFADSEGGPYTASPQLATPPATAGGTATCPTNWTLDGTGAWCNAPLQAGATGTTQPSFTPLVPWLEMKPGVGFSFPIDGQHDQYVMTGQLDFTGVLETYIVDYIPFVDSAKPSCISSACGTGYNCNAVSKACEAADGSVRVLAIEGSDFTGEAFFCQDQMSGDILGVHQYDSALAIIDWLAAHPGGWDPNLDQVDPKAQDACQIIVRYSPYNNYIDYLTAKSYGVKLDIDQGSGLGRVTDIILYDPGITQAP
jgi:hypothetical protein